MQQDYSTRKKILLFLGVFLIIIGVFLLLYGFIQFSMLWSNFGNINTPNNQQDLNSFAYFGIGGFLLVMGIGCTYLSIIRGVSKYIATETSPAVTIASRAFGKGMHESGTTPPRQIIKVKCPSCGFLESEDAEFCSKCGKKI